MEDAEKYLLSKVFKDPDDIKTRKLLVNTFIRDILWYGDHIVITYNFQEYAATDRFCRSYVEQLEKQVGDASRSASSFPLCSYEFRHSAPKSREVSRDFLFADVTFSPWLTRSAPCATIAIPSLRSLQVPSRAPAKSTRYARVLFLFLSFSLRWRCAPQRSHCRVTFSFPRSALGCSASDLSQTAAPSTVHTRSHTEYHTVCGNALPSSMPSPLLLPRRSVAADHRAKTRNYCGSSPCYAPS